MREGILIGKGRASVHKNGRNQPKMWTEGLFCIEKWVPSTKSCSSSTKRGRKEEAPSDGNVKTG